MYPEATWTLAADAYGSWPTSELLDSLPEWLLQETPVRVGDAFYLPSPARARQEMPTLRLLSSWRSDNSLADALQSVEAVLWVDAAGICWSSRQLLAALTLEQLSIPVEVDTVGRGGSRSTVSRKRSAEVFIRWHGRRAALTRAAEVLSDVTSSATPECPARSP